MAINDIKISQFAELAAGSITDNTAIAVEESDSNFKLLMGKVKGYCKFLVTDEPLITDNSLGNGTEFVVKATAQSKVTLLSLMTYIKAHIPHIVIPTRGSLRLSAISTQIILDDTTPTILECFDSAVTERGDVLVDDVDGSIKYIGESTSTAIVTIGLNISFPATESLEVFLYKNGILYSANPLVLVGDGTSNPASVFWQSDINLVENDIFDIRGRNGETGSFTITYLRSTFRLDVN